MTLKKSLFKILWLFIFTLFIFSCSSNDGDEQPDDNPITSVDTESPSIALSGLIENQTVSETTLLDIGLTDNSNQDVFLEIFLDDNSIYSSDTDYTFSLDPEFFIPGEKVIRLVATDTSGNTSSLSIRFNIKRILLRLELEENYFRPPISESFAFVSSNDGAVLDSLVLSENEGLKFLAPFDFDENSDFLLTLVTKNSNGSVNMETIPHLNREITDHVLLTNEGRFSFETFEIDFGSTGFFELQGLGYGYFIFTPNNQTGNLDLLDEPEPPEHIYVLARGDFVNSPHYYAKLKRDTISNPLVLTRDDFSANDVTVGNFPYSQNSQLDIFGFESSDDFQTYKLHQATFGLGQIVNQNRILYPYIDNFPFYRHSYTDLYGTNLNGYRYLGEGLPLNAYNTIETNLSTSINGNKIVIDLDPIADYHSGKIHLKPQGENLNWVFNFDTANDLELTIPKLPELMGLEDYKNLTYEVKSTRISNYSNVTSFAEYLSDVRSNDLKYYNHSSNVQHITVWPTLNNRVEIISPLY